ncbi:extracellular sulfatase Sulf-2-like isoform X2 [Apostichopus japonicus]|uniref:extracellular sulfatase Sulf-2-like isoform X2 n=1 Tax=Stichopus japonicus TaxID=307972 RepID=UPI003AB367D1
MKLLPEVRMLRFFLLLPILMHCGNAGSPERRKSANTVPPESNRKPNIVFILTDDQDLLLGSMTVMNKTRYHLGSKGANFINAFVTSPMCCPSRSSILTGQYVHNHKVYSNVDSYCVAPHWRRGPERRNFGAFLQAASYRTGYFGKYLNNYDGSYIPPGWTEWAGLIGNSKFYKYAINHNGQVERHGYDYHQDYLPDLIANDSMSFFKVSKRAFPDGPVAMVLSFPSPHGPEDCAPQYTEEFKNNQLHRTPSWNYGPNDDKHWLLQYTQQMTPLEQNFTDAMHRKRLLTLLSVDDAVDKVCRELEAMGELDNTYIIYTSDHGYHLGQFGVLKGKSLPYDFDIRVPFYMRGPAIPRDIEVPNIVLNIDIATTLLDIAGAEIPSYMDGVSLLKLFLPRSNYRVHHKSKRWKYKGDEEWRDSFMVERSRSPEDVERLIQRQLKAGANSITEMCKGEDYQYPCQEGQGKYCEKDETGAWVVRKCVAYQCDCDDEDDESSTERRRDDKRRRHTKRGSSRDKFGNLFRPRRSSARRNAVGGVPMCWVEKKVVKCSKEVLLEDSVIEAQERLVKAHLRLYRRHITDLKHIHKYLKKAKGANLIPFPESSRANRNFSRSGKSGKRKNCMCEELDPSDELPLGQSLQPYRRDRRNTGRRQSRKSGRKSKEKKELKEETGCKDAGMSCFYHDDTHWKTPPLWNDAPVCGCTNNQNNSYWCIRTINNTHNFLYCEYVTGFLEYFDMRPSKDPFQLTNAIRELETNSKTVLSQEVRFLKVCYGSNQCTLNSTGKVAAQSQPVIVSAFGEDGKVENSSDHEE